jgi:predicted ATPase/class 3 adenylate cyclase
MQHGAIRALDATEESRPLRRYARERPRIMTDLPSGTLTLLFTDLEGSTRLLEQLGNAYGAVLADQRAILRTAFANWNGREMDTQGDAFFVVFTRAGDALQAAVEAQRALGEHSWPPDAFVRVRMGLHTGEPWLGSTGYTGMDIHSAARICAAGHGGQVLLSRTTRDLVEGSLPAGVTLRDLGEHRLKDLRRPRQLYQLVIGGLPADFPPLKSLNPDRHNLPIQLTSFIGREHDIAAVMRLLATTRLLTLTGPGGTGKTRLALQVATEMLTHFPDGVWLVELAPVSNPVLVPQTLATTLRLSEESGRPLLTTLTNHLRAKHSLLVLDNCEHLIEACAQLCETLLRACPNLNILATSREPLGIAGETTFLVPSLSLPDMRHAPSVEGLTQYESVRLFVDRAAAAMPDFIVTRQNALSVAQVCLRLDGMPLAIELAAARVKMLTVEQIATRLQDRFRLLLGGNRTALPRHQTLSALIDWSYDLLSEPERALLRRLSVFAGGWTLEAAEAVCVGERNDGYNILDLLTQLVNKSLVVAEREQGREARYHLLETIRQYAKEKLLEVREEANVRNGHLQFFLKWAEETEPKLHGAQQIVWLDRLEAEHDNLRAAWEWSRADRASEEQGLRLADALLWFWYIRNAISEGRSWLEDALSRGRASERTTARAKALYAAGALGYKQADYPRARGELEESITLFREAGPEGRRGLAYALIMLGELAEYQGDMGQPPSLFQEGAALFRDQGDKWGLALSLHGLGVTRNPTHLGALSLRWSGLTTQATDDLAPARSLYEESLALFRELEDKWAQTMPLGSLGNVAFCQGDRVMGRALFEESLAIQREFRDKLGVAWSLFFLGHAALDQDDYERAATLYEESQALYREIDNKQGISGLSGDLAEVARRQGDFGQAARLNAEYVTGRRELGNRQLLANALEGQARLAWSQGDLVSAHSLHAEALAIRREAGNPLSLAHSFESFAILAAAQQQAQRATRLFGAAERFHEALYYSELPMWRAEHDRSVGAVHAQLGEATFAQAWAEGQAMTMDQAIACALAS